MQYKIQELFVVPPIVVTMRKHLEMLRTYDLSSVKFLYTGAAPLGKELFSDLRAVYPDWQICQAYGLTESATVLSSTSRADIWPGSSGSLLPGAEIRIIDQYGKDIDAYGTSGEIWAKAPSVVLGYLGNEQATNQTFIEDENGRWLKTGDEGEVRLCPESGNEHLWIVDRIKELIKVNVLNLLVRCRKLLTFYRVIKLPLQNSSPIFSAIQLLLTVRLFQFPMRQQEKHQKRML
jgi:acyl-CoA synthetase (AMP-forming)/AMP-acid ligase II